MSMEDNQDFDSGAYVVQINDLLAFHKYWLDGSGARWPNGKKFSEHELARVCNLISFSQIYGKWCIHPTYDVGQTRMSADEFCKVIESKLGGPGINKRYPIGWYLALVQEYEKSEYQTPELLYYGTYEHEAPDTGTEEEIEANLGETEILNGTSIMGVGFHKTLEQMSGEYDEIVKVYHFDKFPKIIKLEKLNREFDSRRIKVDVEVKDPVRSYEEAVEIAVNFWVEKSFFTESKQDNGDRSVMGSLAMKMMNSKTQEVQSTVTNESIEKFKTCLRNKLLNVYNTGFRRGDCAVDYAPNQVLFEVCQEAGISNHCLPIKTFTFIDEDNTVKGRYQYGGDWFSL
ncbi:hypothetical protein [Leptospira levettii]|uniref:hypothetical protein n=1 Tax=Leptospira levettii TaxID=2023178 RepID=UPI000C2A37CD|nr:hypothetical protein [Leptospira levettii]PJZ89536.1 hypothetical protein CH368_06145 [Leptospira levettii]